MSQPDFDLPTDTCTRCTHWVYDPALKVAGERIVRRAAQHLLGPHDRTDIRRLESRKVDGDGTISIPRSVVEPVGAAVKAVDRAVHAAHSGYEHEAIVCPRAGEVLDVRKRHAPTRRVIATCTLPRTVSSPPATRH